MPVMVVRVVFVSDGVAKQWLSRFGGWGSLRVLQSAGHLESQYGERIRRHGWASAASLRAGLHAEYSVAVSMRLCVTWLGTTWSSSGALVTAAAVEASWGDRLRLPEFRERYGDDAAA